MAKYMTRPGKYGTLYLYAYSYRCRLDGGSTVVRTNMWAYDAEHVLDAFDDTQDPDWEIVDYPKRVRDAR